MKYVYLRIRYWENFFSAIGVRYHSCLRVHLQRKRLPINEFNLKPQDFVITQLRRSLLKKNWVIWSFISKIDITYIQNIYENTWVRIIKSLKTIFLLAIGNHKFYFYCSICYLLYGEWAFCSVVIISGYWYIQYY